MPKTATPKWATIATWKRYRLAFTKAEAEDALKAWMQEHKDAGWTIHGSLQTGYRAERGDVPLSVDKERAKIGEEPLANRSARVIKLADHPVCYIGVTLDDVERLRALEISDPEAFEGFSARAKALSEEWRSVEAL